MPGLQLVVLAAALTAAVRGSPAILGSGAADGPRPNRPTGDILDHDPAFLATALALVGHALSEQLAAESTQAPEPTPPQQTEATNAAIAGDGLSLAANLVAARGESAFPEQQPIGEGLTFASDLVSSVGQGISPTVATPVGDGRRAESQVNNVNNFQSQPASLSSGLRSLPSLPARPAVPAAVPTEQPAPAAHIPAAPIQKSVPTLGPQHSVGQQLTATPSIDPTQQASAISFPSFEQFLSSLGSTTSPPSPAIQEQTEAPAVNVEPNSNTAPLEPQPVVEQPASEPENSLSAENTVTPAAFHPAASLFGLFGGLPQLWNQATLNPFAATVHHPFAAAVQNPFASTVQNPFASTVQNPFAAAVPFAATGPSPLSAGVSNPLAATDVNPFAAAVPNSLDVAGSSPVPQIAPTGLSEAQTVAGDFTPISVASTTPQVLVSPLPDFSQTAGQSVVSSEAPSGNVALTPFVPESQIPVIAPVQENTFTQPNQVTTPASVDTSTASLGSSSVTAGAPSPQTAAVAADSPVAVDGPAVAVDSPADADSELAFDVAAVLAVAQLGAQLATEHHEAARAAAEAQLAALQATTLETSEPSEGEKVAPGETQQADLNSETGDNPVEQQPIEAVEQQGATEHTVVEQNELHNVPQFDDDDTSEAQPPSSSQVVAESSAPGSEQVTTPQVAVEEPAVTQVEPEQLSVTSSEETLNQNTEQTTTEQAAADVLLANDETKDTPLADGTTTTGPDSGIVTGESQTAEHPDTAPGNEPVPVEEPLPKQRETGDVLIANNEPTETPAGSPEVTSPGPEPLITEPESTPAPQPDDDESEAQTASSVLEEEQLVLPVAAEPEVQPVESHTTPAPTDVVSDGEGAVGHTGERVVEDPQSAVSDGGSTTDSGRHVSSQELAEIRRVLGSQPRPTKRPQIPKSSGLGKLTVVRAPSRLYSRRGKSGRRTFKKFRLVPRRSFTGSEGSSRLSGGRQGAADRLTLPVTDDSEVSQSGPVSRFGQRISGPKKVKSYANFYLWQGTVKPEEMPTPVNINRNRGRSNDRNGGNFVDRRGGWDRSGPSGFTDVYGPRFSKYGTPNSRGGNGDRRVFSYNRGFNTRRGFVSF